MAKKRKSTGAGLFALRRPRLKAEPPRQSGRSGQPRPAAQQAVRRKTGKKKANWMNWRPRLNPSGVQSPLAQDMLREFKRPFDQPMLMITMMLLVVGLIFLLSASYPKGYYSTSESIGPLTYFFNQLRMAVVGLVIMMIVSAFDYHQYRMWGKVLYIITTLLLIAVPFIGEDHNGAKRWLFGFQPSELAKVALILVIAAMISQAPERIRQMKGLIPYAVVVGIYILLLVPEKHTSAMLILMGIAVIMLMVGGMKLWYFLPVGAVGALGAIILYNTMEHVRARFAVWLHPFEYRLSGGWQACQSLIAVGSGGLTGLGIGQSRQKFLYLPEPMNDFIFAVVCEEVGLIGAILVILLFAYFVFRGFWIACRAQDRFGCLIATGITAKFAIQTIINLCVVTGIFPVTGASLPLFSYGGTALILQMVEIGILLNISRHIPPSKRE
ncbi:MAG: FtsW/RodA/SpoVE family cell cycle protein [Butyricicoccaceae bacterium]